MCFISIAVHIIQSDVHYQVLMASFINKHSSLVYFNSSLEHVFSIVSSSIGWLKLDSTD